MNPKVFREADTNKSGELDMEEFRAKLKDIDPTMDDALINRAFQVNNLLPKLKPLTLYPKS